MKLNLNVFCMYSFLLCLLNQNVILPYEDLGWKSKSLIILGVAGITIGLGVGIGYSLIVKAW